MRLTITKRFQQPQHMIFLKSRTFTFPLKGSALQPHFGSYELPAARLWSFCVQVK
jgi:hypothetical protein